MSIGIIGAGSLGSTIARLLANNNIKATIANNRGPASLVALVKDLGTNIEAGTAEEAARADIVIVAVRWADVGNALNGLPAWNGRVVVDATNAVVFLAPDSPDRKDTSNPLAGLGIKPIDLRGKQSSMIFSTLAPGARVVKAFNHVSAPGLLQPKVSGGTRVLFYSGDDAAAKADVRKLIEQTGHAPIDLGPLAVGAALASAPFGPLATASLIKI